MAAFRAFAKHLVIAKVVTGAANDSNGSSIAAPVTIHLKVRKLKIIPFLIGIRKFHAEGSLLYNICQLIDFDSKLPTTLVLRYASEAMGLPPTTVLSEIGGERAMEKRANLRQRILASVGALIVLSLLGSTVSVYRI